MDFRRKVISVVGNLPDEGTDEEFVDATFGLLSAALSKMAPAEREEVLLAIEGGSLRRAVAKFPQRLGLPSISNGNGAGL
jgi:hypothetical protein